MTGSGIEEKIVCPGSENFLWQLDYREEREEGPQEA